MSRTHHRVAQSYTEYYLSDKTRINTDRHRLKDCSSLSYICFPLRKSAIICVSIKIQTLWNSVLLCGEIHSKPHSNEDDGPVFSVAEVPLNGIDPLVRCCTLAFSERNVPFPCGQYCFTCTSKAVRHAHVEQYDMYMWSSETCTCKTTLHTGEPYVTLRDKVLSIPGKAEAVMTNAVIIR